MVFWFTHKLYFYYRTSFILNDLKDILILLIFCNNFRYQKVQFLLVSVNYSSYRLKLLIRNNYNP